MDVFSRGFRKAAAEFFHMLPAGHAGTVSVSREQAARPSGRRDAITTYETSAAWEYRNNSVNHMDDCVNRCGAAAMGRSDTGSVRGVESGM
jgi:hypothetical protein